jgi:hypothetical protein
MIPTLAMPDIQKSFCLQDVTDDPVKLSDAFDIVVDGYSGLSSRILDRREVRETVCNDEYHRHGLARTLLLSGWTRGPQEWSLWVPSESLLVPPILRNSGCGPWRP